MVNFAFATIVNGVELTAFEVDFFSFHKRKHCPILCQRHSPTCKCPGKLFEHVPIYKENGRTDMFVGETCCIFYGWKMDKIIARKCGPRLIGINVHEQELQTLTQSE